MVLNPGTNQYHYIVVLISARRTAYCSKPIVAVANSNTVLYFDAVACVCWSVLVLGCVCLPNARRRCPGRGGTGVMMRCRVSSTRTPVLHSKCTPVLHSKNQRERGKGEGPRRNWEKVQVLWICRDVGVVPSRVLWDEYGNLGVQNDHQMMPDISS